MPNPRIKICGVRSAAAIEAAIAARASHVGFNFYDPSPRFLADHELATLGAQAAGRIVRVGVFVDASASDIARRLASGAIDIVQLHGSENPAQVAAVRAQFGKPVWNVVQVASAADIARADAYAGAADFILFDAKTPKGTLPGGMGLAFDWDLLAHARIGLPWGLAGGLTPGNVGDAVRRTGAGLVDTASGVESAPGIKDDGLIAAFCAAARG